MAAGLSAALDRFCTVIDGCGGGWSRSRQRLSTLAADQVIASGVEHRYWISSSLRGFRPVIVGDQNTNKYDITIELARYFGGGELQSKEFYSLSKTLEAEADVVEQSLLHKNNWAGTTTGIWLVSLVGSRHAELTFDRKIMFRNLQFEVIIRQPKTAVLVA